MFDGFQIIVDYVNQQPVIGERLQAFLFGYIQDFWLTQITAGRWVRILKKLYKQIIVICCDIF